MIQLYKWTTENQIDQFTQYLAQYGAATAPLLGYIISTGYYKSDAKGKNSIWCSHADPLNTSDVVIWLVDSDHRIRIFVSSQHELNDKPLTEEAIALAHSAKYPDGIQLPPYFVDAKAQKLYEQSLTVVEQFLTLYMNKRYKPDDEGVLYHDTSLLWSPVLHKIFKINFDAPCYSYVRQASIPLKPIQLPPHIELDSLYAEDVDTVVSKNKIAYDPNYVIDCMRISSALRVNNKLIAWVMSHRDLHVGALHVLPEYRRQGLAEVLLLDLCRKYIEFFGQKLPSISLDHLYFGASVESFNSASARLFEKADWCKYGLGTTWIHCHKKT